jgi:hypothetical protein
MSETEQNKRKLLQTPMNELKMNYIILKWFQVDVVGNKSLAMTLQEFFNANQALLGYTERFIINKKGELGFIEGSQAWKELKKVLLSFGFTHHDWIMLLPKVGNDYLWEMLDKDQRVMIPFTNVCVINSKGETARYLGRILSKKGKDLFKISIAQLLETTREDIYTGFFIEDEAKRVTVRTPIQIRDLWRCFERIQKTFRAHGFVEGDGEFMRINFLKKGFSPNNLMGALTRMGKQGEFSFEKPAALFFLNAESRNFEQVTFITPEKFS